MLPYCIVLEHTYKTNIEFYHFISPEDEIDAGTDQWGGHFSKCPEELTHYCVHGECRYIQEQKAPSCRWETSQDGKITVAEKNK